MLKRIQIQLNICCIRTKTKYLRDFVQVVKSEYSIFQQELDSRDYRVSTLHSQPKAKERIDSLSAASVVIDLLPCVGLGLVLARSHEEKGIYREDYQLVDHKNCRKASRKL